VGFTDRSNPKICMKLTLAIPGLTWLDRYDGALVTRDLEMPSLSLLLGRARLTPEPGTLSTLLGRPFSVPGVHLARMAAESDGLDTRQGHWLIADPVHLKIERDRALLADIGIMRLTQDEADALVATLNQHFASDGLQFFAPTPGRWYLQHQQPTGASFHPLADVVGENIDEFRPQGENGLRWGQLLNEMQMLLFSHPLNETREAQGDTSINSVWLWGGGSEPLPATMHGVLHADNVISRLLAAASNTKLECTPYALSALLESSNGDASTWVQLDSLLAAAQYRDAWGWRNGLSALEANWFSPALLALRQGQLTELTLMSHGDAGLYARVTRTDLWKLWRRARPLAELY
jgi:hypothetical protein